MQATANRRDGIRVVAGREIEGIIHVVDRFPDFCTHFIFNMGGLLINHGTEHHQNNNIMVYLFHRNGSSLSIDSEVISSSPEQLIIKFNSLNPRQRQILRKILLLEQADRPADRR